MSKTIKKIAIVGGGTAGWLSAAIIAAHHKSDDPNGLEVVLVEASDIPTIGVGEGTWPTMKNTIRRIGVTAIFTITHLPYHWVTDESIWRLTLPTLKISLSTPTFSIMYVRQA